MVILQLIAVIFGLAMLYIVRIHKKKNDIESFEYGIWVALWTCFLVLTIFPQSVQGVAQTLRIARVFDLLVVVAFMILTSLTISNRIERKRIDKKIEKVIREKALENAKKNTNN